MPRKCPKRGGKEQKKKGRRHFMGISWAFLRHALFHSSFMPGLCQPMFLDFGITLAFCWHFLGILFSIFHGVELGASSTGRRARWDGIFGIFWAFSAKSSSTVCHASFCHSGICLAYATLAPSPPSPLLPIPGIFLALGSIPCLSRLFSNFQAFSRHFSGIFFGCPRPLPCRSVVPTIRVQGQLRVKYLIWLMNLLSA